MPEEPGSPQKQRLDQLLRQRGIMTGSQLVQRKAEIDQQRASGDFEIDKVVPGEVVGDADAGFYLVRQEFPIDYLHGDARLGLVLEVDAQHIALSACDNELAAFDPRRTLFMDTETIGLAGGTGTVAFLIGAGYFKGDAFLVEQGFMRDYDDEEALLGYLAERMRGYDCVVGYNSKSFDLPLLRTRFIQNRVPFALDAFLHYDLVHASRRLWKARLNDCSLGNVERHILGFTRVGDVPSFLIPQLYFDYLRKRDARPLSGVFYHHRMDIVSLAALTGIIAARLAAPDDGGFAHAEDRLALVRLHHRQKRYDDAAAQALRYLEEHDAEDALRRDCLELLANAYKRLEQWSGFEETLTLLLREYPRDLGAALELAKYFEHRCGDLAQAETICAQALDQLARTSSLSFGQDIAALEKRLARIRRKRTRGGGGEGGTLL